MIQRTFPTIRDYNDTMQLTETSRRMAREHLSMAAICEGIAEEAAELAAEAAKLGRIFRGENPAGATAEETHEALVEELSDLTLMCLIGDIYPDESIVVGKAARMASRLLKKQQSENIERKDKKMAITIKKGEKPPTIDVLYSDSRFAQPYNCLFCQHNDHSNYCTLTCKFIYYLGTGDFEEVSTYGCELQDRYCVSSDTLYRRHAKED